MPNYVECTSPLEIWSLHAAADLILTFNSFLARDLDS